MERIDISAFSNGEPLLTSFDLAIVGSIEEFGVAPSGQTLIRDQFETNFHGPVNVMRAVIPSMRIIGGGHVVIITSISKYV